MRYILFIISYCLLTVAAIAQDDLPSDSTQTDTIATKIRQPLFSGISVTADLGKLITGQLTEFENKETYSLHVMLWRKIRLSGEFGNGKINPADAYQNIEYVSEGQFYNYGISYVVSPKAGNLISLGIRKASADYNDNGTITILSDSKLSADYERSFSRTSLSADWYELIISSETTVFKSKSGRKNSAINKLLDNFFLGMNFRIRMLLDYPEQEAPDTYAIPGYGRTFDKTIPVVNIFLKYKIGFRSEVPPN